MLGDGRRHHGDNHPGGAGQGCGLYDLASGGAAGDAGGGQSH